MQSEDGVLRFAQQREGLLKGDEAGVQRQRARGRLLARERIELLLDPGSFVEADAFLTDGNALTGYGLVNSRPVYVLAQDVSQREGAMSRAQAAKMMKTLDLAAKTGAPIVIFPDSRGAAVGEGAQVLAAYAQVFAKLADLNGLCPIISVLAGEAVGSASHFLMLSDFAIAVDKLCEVLPFPAAVMNAVYSKSLEASELGGAEALAAKGAAALTAPDEQAAIRLARRLVDLLPSSAYENPPFEDSDALNRLIAYPAASARALAEDIADQGSAIELFAPWRKSVATYLARVGGYTCGIVSVDGAEDGGRLDGFACDKIAKLVSFCDSYDLPVITLVDSEGLAVPSIESQAWLMTASARMLSAYAQASTPKIALIVGNAVGASYVAFAGKSMADITLAWPEAYIAPLSREAQVQVFEADKLAGTSRGELEQQAAAEADAFAAAQAGIVDDVIAPEQSRKHLIAALELLQSKSGR